MGHFGKTKLILATCLLILEKYSPVCRDPSFIFFPFVLSDIPVQVYMGKCILLLLQYLCCLRVLFFFFSVLVPPTEFLLTASYFIAMKMI